MKTVTPQTHLKPHERAYEPAVREILRETGWSESIAECYDHATRKLGFVIEDHEHNVVGFVTFFSPTTKTEYPFDGNPITSNGKWISVDNIAIKKSERGKGHGGRAVHALLSLAEKNGYDGIAIPHNMNRDFWNHVGVRRVGRTWFLPINNRMPKEVGRYNHLYGMWLTSVVPEAIA